MALTLLFVSAVVITNLTGSPPELAVANGVGNVVLGVVAATVYARGPYGDRPRVETAAQLYRLLAAGVIGSMVSMPIGVGGPVLLMHEPLGHIVQWVLRSTISVVVVGIVGFRLALPGNRELSRPSMPTRILGIALTLLVYGFVFTSSDQVWFFLLVPVSMYMALRTDVRTTACHTVAVSTFAIVASLIGLGPLHDVDVTVRGLLAQGIVVVVSVVAMTLVLDREHHERLNSSIEAHRLASAGQAELLERLVASLQDGVLLTADDGSIAMHNTSARAMLAQLGSGDGQLPACLFDPQFDEPKPLNRVFMTGEEVVQDVPVCIGDECVAIYSVICRGLTLSEETQAVVVLRDVTAYRRRTEELSQFARVVAHDLRNPLSAIRAWVEVLQDELADDPERADKLARVAAGGRRMNELIEDLLTYSVVRGGDVTLETVDLQGLCEEVVEMQRDRLDLPEPPLVTVDAPAWVHADPAGLRQVLTNLVGNAVKYTAPDTTPIVEIVACSSEGDRVDVTVADRGIGLPPGEEERVFAEFHRVPAHASEYSGTGLGLAICRRGSPRRTRRGARREPASAFGRRGRAERGGTWRVAGSRDVPGLLRGVLPSATGRAPVPSGAV